MNAIAARGWTRSPGFWFAFAILLTLCRAFLMGMRKEYIGPGWPYPELQGAITVTMIAGSALAVADIWRFGWRPALRLLSCAGALVAAFLAWNLLLFGLPSF